MCVCVRAYVRACACSEREIQSERETWVGWEGGGQRMVLKAVAQCVEILYSNQNT